MYKSFFKRFFDFFVSLAALIVLSPLLVVLTVCGAIAMRGDPFFVYPRAGRDGKIFQLIKFRSMSNLKDENGNYLPDEIRLNKYGRILRSTSLDELPELLNILKGDMSIVGPRPLSGVYLPYYTAEERHRHDVKPGLTGLAQVNGRNDLSWEEKFAYDLQYVDHITFAGDVKIILLTVKKVLVHEGIGQGEKMPLSLHRERADWILTDKGAVKPSEDRQSL